MAVAEQAQLEQPVAAIQAVMVVLEQQILSQVLVSLTQAVEAAGDPELLARAEAGLLEANRAD